MQGCWVAPAGLAGRAGAAPAGLAGRAGAAPAGLAGHAEATLAGHAGRWSGTRRGGPPDMPASRRIVHWTTLLGARLSRRTPRPTPRPPAERRSAGPHPPRRCPAPALP